MGDTSCWDSKLQTTLFRMFVAKPVICLIAFVAFASAISDSDYRNKVVKYHMKPAVPGFTTHYFGLVNRNKCCLWNYKPATYKNVKTLGDCQKKCAAKSWCKSIDYNYGHDECALSKKSIKTKPRYYYCPCKNFWNPRYYVNTFYQTYCGKNNEKCREKCIGHAHDLCWLEKTSLLTECIGASLD